VSAVYQARGAYTDADWTHSPHGPAALAALAEALGTDVTVSRLDLVGLATVRTMRAR